MQIPYGGSVASFITYDASHASMVYMMLYRGMRQFMPREHRKLEKILTGWVTAACTYGFEQYKTPLLDPLSLYTGKTSEEIVSQQTYSFTDRADREVVLRPEITPGVSAMMAELQKDRTIRPPYKLFSIGSVFRYEREQKGRTREHIQFNVDIFGESSLWAEAEVIAVAFASLERMGFAKDSFIVRLNDRRAMQQALKKHDVKQADLPEVFRLLDRQNKMESSTFNELFSRYTSTPWSTIEKTFSEGVDKESALEQLIALLTNVFGIPAEIDASIVRGFDYYTGIVFELYANDKKKASRSVAGGGRYDTLIESYGGSSLPAVGLAMGDVVVSDCLPTTEEKGTVQTVVCVNDSTLCGTGLTYAELLRNELHLPASFIGVVREADLSKVYQYHEKEGVAYVISFPSRDTCIVRSLSTRQSHTLSLSEDTDASVFKKMMQDLYESEQKKSL